MSRNEARPGQEVDITVISKPNSYVGLLGVDQSVLLLRKGNDFDKTQIFNELDEYSRKQLSPSRYYGIDEWEDFAVCFSFAFFHGIDLLIKILNIHIEFRCNFADKCQTS